MDYIAYLHKDRTSDFGVSFPDFPGCVTAGRTRDEAFRKAPEALAMHIEGMVEDGDTIPKPSTLDEIKDDPNRRDAVAILVSVHLDKRDKPVRVNITAKESQIAKIDDLARLAGMNRSHYMVQLALGAPPTLAVAGKHNVESIGSTMAARARRVAGAAKKAAKAAGLRDEAGDGRWRNESGVRQKAKSSKRSRGKATSR
jgi:predicted RNase H-like HicB family nuclease